jgi:hypothetical protein
MRRSEPCLLLVFLGERGVVSTSKNPEGGASAFFLLDQNIRQTEPELFLMIVMM